MTVLVLGSINMDLVVETPRLPKAGETLRGRAFHSGPGGKGANQAVAAALQGATTRLIGRVGADDFGDQLVGSLRGYGIGVSGINIDHNAATGLALICVDDDGENTIVTVRGANGNVGRQELEILERLLARAIVFMVQLEIPLDVVGTAVAAAREAGVIVVLDPAPVTELPAKLLTNVSWITPNSTETEALTGIVPSDVEAAARAADALRTRGVSRVALKLGARGCFYSGPDGQLSVPAPEVRAVDSVGAGDAFNGALAAALVAGHSPAEILRRATAAGAIATTKRGAQPSLPTAAELDRVLGTN
jgi:ribokinase